MAKQRLDILLVERGLVSSREKGRRLIMAGKVRVDGQVSDKPGHRVPDDVTVTVEARPPYVSRGGLKLEAALARFDLDVTGWVAADVGASTGGFTDCLLQHGAIHVYAVDVGYGQLAWKLRNDPRVTVMERTNARYLETLPQAVHLVTVDASFISLELLLEPAANWLVPHGLAIPLVKPQFEAGPRHVGKGGVVRDPDTHRRVLSDFLTWAEAHDWGILGLIPSPLLGPAGNVEFLVHLRHRAASSVAIETAIAAALAEAETLKNAVQNA
jgi:23S rRNA (cytidine1920-2'-O)/16S rRNA (cytidine1409-2'-O)-methyltransferase